MADSHEDLWRSKIPHDYDGRHGENWDDEIATGFAYRTAILIVISLVFSLVLCWFIILGLDAYRDKPASPIAEANLRQLPPTPHLQSSPDRELSELRAEMGHRLHGYGWTDPLDDRVHIPIDKAMELVLKGTPRIPVEPAADKPVDVAAPGAAQPGDVPDTGAIPQPPPAGHSSAGGH